MKKIQIEARIMGDLATNHILPTAVNYQTKLINNIRGLRELGIDEEYQQTTLDTVKKMSEYMRTIRTNVDAMIDARKRANKIEDTRERAYAYCFEVKSYFDLIRRSADKLELMVDDEDWPLVKSREMMFMH